MRISSPQFLYPCYFGTDIPDRDQLSCNRYTVEQLRQNLDADSLSFLELDSVEQIAPCSKIGFCKACFDGKYPCAVDDTVDQSLID